MKSTLKSKRKTGVQALNFLEDILPDNPQSPRYAKPAAMIETIKIIGEDRMTAKDAALYELLLSNARNEDIAKEQHEIETSTCIRFLDIAHTERLLEGLERITSTLVRYDFLTDDNTKRHRGSIPLIIAEITDDLKAGTSTLTYAIPSAIRKVILQSKQYGLLEIKPFASFQCKYSARLYQKLAYRAGMSNGFGKVWEVTPLELAELLDYRFKDFRYSNFEARCLRPAMHDIDIHVTRFYVEMEEVRGKGRGRPVEKIIFRISETIREFEELPSKRITKDAFIQLRDDESGDLPSQLSIGRAAKAFNMNGETIIAMWKSYLSHHRGLSDDVLKYCAAGSILAKLKEPGGADAAFKIWVEWHQIQKTKPSYQHDHEHELEINVPKPESKAAPAPAPKPLTLPKFALPSAPKEKSTTPKTAPRIGMEIPELDEGITQIIFWIDENVGHHEMNEEVVASILNHHYTGDRKIPVCIRRSIGNNEYETLEVAKFKVSERDLDRLVKKNAAYLVDGAEVEVSR